AAAIRRAPDLRRAAFGFSDALIAEAGQYQRQIGGRPADQTREARIERAFTAAARTARGAQRFSQSLKPVGAHCKHAESAIAGWSEQRRIEPAWQPHRKRARLGQEERTLRRVFGPVAQQGMKMSGARLDERREIKRVLAKAQTKFRQRRTRSLIQLAGV